MRYLVLTPLRGLTPDADGTISAEQLGGDVDVLCAVGAIQLAQGGPGEDLDPAETDAAAGDAFVARFVDRDDPLMALAASIDGAVERAGFDALDAIERPREQSDSTLLGEFLDRMEGRDDPATALLELLQPALEARGWSPPSIFTPAASVQGDGVPPEVTAPLTPSEEAGAKPTVSIDMRRDSLVEIATAEGVAFETDANKAALIHAITCHREGKSA